MSQALLRGILPVGMGVIVCTIGVLFLSAAGLLHEPVPLEAESSVADSVGSDSVAAVQRLNFSNLTDEQKAQYTAGDALFKANCAQCHAIHEQVVGPALAGISKRRPEKWLHSWIRNSGKVVASSDPYAVALYEKYGKQQMPSFQLSTQKISAILAYVKVEEDMPRYTVAVGTD